MIACAAAKDAWERPVSAASAADPALPSLQADNCIGAHRRKARFLAQENIRLFIAQVGVDHIGVLTTTAVDVLEAREFQRKWHSFLTNVLKKIFPTGMWTRERQRRSGNWHSHAVVDVGFDIKSAFPFEQVEKRIYSSVDVRTRALWKALREGATKCGLGRIELLPIKKNGEGCAFYVTKYLGKSLGSDKCAGEEKCRLFGIWGSRRFVRSGFDWVSNRIMRKRKAWLAFVSGLISEEEFRFMFGPRWWRFLGPDLMNVIMPPEYYQVRRNGEMVFDEVGWRHYQNDIQRFSDIENLEDRITHSHYLLHRAHGMMLFGNGIQGTQYAMARIGFSVRESLAVNPLLFLKLEAAIGRTIEGSSP